MDMKAKTQEKVKKMGNGAPQYLSREHAMHFVSRNPDAAKSVMLESISPVFTRWRHEIYPTALHHLEVLTSSSTLAIASLSDKMSTLASASTGVGALTKLASSSVFVGSTTASSIPSWPKTPRASSEALTLSSAVTLASSAAYAFAPSTALSFAFSSDIVLASFRAAINASSAAFTLTLLCLQQLTLLLLQP
jgi:hypothetical protein